MLTNNYPFCPGLKNVKNKEEKTEILKEKKRAENLPFFMLSLYFYHQILLPSHPFTLTIEIISIVPQNSD